MVSQNTRENNDILISIVIPAYNAERYLNSCLNSVVNQSYKNLEIICVNDGSTDNTQLILEQYSKKDCRIKIINRENGGLSAARNSGIDIATGDYIGFVDADDWIDKDMYKILYENIRKHKSEIAVCKFVCVFKLKINTARNTDPVTLKGIKAIDNLFSNFYGDYAWNKLYKKSLFDNIRYPEGTYFEDRYVTYKLYERASKITFVDKGLYYYLQHKQSIMHENFGIKKMKDNINSYVERLENKHFSENYLFWESFVDTLRTYLMSSLKKANEEGSQQTEYLNSVIEKYLMSKDTPDIAKQSLKKIKKITVLNLITDSIYNTIRNALLIKQ